MHEPHFWRDLPRGSRASAPVTRFLLTPVSHIYSALGRRRLARTIPVDPGLPVLCIGNLTLGGAGKTPVSAAIREELVSRGLRPATLSRGYGGKLIGPLRIDPAAHHASDTGDEPLMLAATGETWISRDRPAGAQAMRQAGVDIVIMDDGHQNPTLRKTGSIVVIDAGEPFGNRHVFPKGPLREPVSAGLSRADAVILMGDGDIPAEVAASGVEVLRARLSPVAPLAPGAYVAFAGIGRPQRFFDSLSAMPGVTLADAAPFPDHHMYSASDLTYLTRLASERGGATLVTTSKDHVRLPPEVRPRVAVLPVEAKFDEPAALSRLLDRLLARGGAPA
jgi:tetraacyldisaccharide 4'-kinase